MIISDFQSPSNGGEGDCFADGGRTGFHCKDFFGFLSFFERNPGITRIFIGDVLLGENEQLHFKVMQFFEKIESQIRQILRESNLGNGPRPISDINSVANQILIYIEGKLSQFVKSSFRKKPTEYFEVQWRIMKAGSFR